MENWSKKDRLSRLPLKTGSSAAFTNVSSNKSVCKTSIVDVQYKGVYEAKLILGKRFGKYKNCTLYISITLVEIDFGGLVRVASGSRVSRLQ